MFSRGETNEDDARGGNNGELTGGCGFHTNFGHPSWWMVDLGTKCRIEKIVLFNRLDYRERLRHFTLLGSIDGSTWTELYRKSDDQEFGGIDGTPWMVDFSPEIDQRFIKVRQDDDGMFLHFDELQVFGRHKGSSTVPAAPILSDTGGHPPNLAGVADLTFTGTTDMARFGTTGEYERIEIFPTTDRWPQIPMRIHVEPDPIVVNEHDYYDVIDPVYAYAIPDAGIIWGMGHVTHGSEFVLLDDCFPSYARGHVTDDGNIFGIESLRPENWPHVEILRVDGPVACPINYNLVYGHFLLEMLPKMFVLATMKRLGADITIVVPTTIPAWARNFLPLYFDMSEVLWFDPATQIVVGQSIVLVSMMHRQYNFNPSFNDMVDDLLARCGVSAHPPGAAAPGGRPNCVYISRRNIKHNNRLENPEEIEELFASLGFTIVCPETLSLREQLEIFANTDVLAGEYSSAIHNSLFCPKGTRVICLDFYSWYQSAIGRLRQQPHGFVAPVDGKMRHWRLIENNQRAYSVAPEAVRRMIREMVPELFLPPPPDDRDGERDAPPSPETTAPKAFVAADPPAPAGRASHADEITYRTPTDLARTELSFTRALVIGSCFSNVMPLYLPFVFRGLAADHLLYNNVGNLPDATPHPIEDYQFQLIMLSLRTVMPEQLYFGLSFTDIDGYATAFNHARNSLIQMLHGALAYHRRHRITTFVANYVTPQQSAMGRLLPRYDLRNPVYFVERLNQVIAEEIAELTDVHFLDIDQISANFGRKYNQDDILLLSSHHSVISDYDLEFDRARLEVPMPITDVRTYRVPEFILAVCSEVHAMYRTLRQTDQVKLVICDLDDTLWRGVIAEEGIDRPMLTEGWPIGLIEALTFLKKRGVLLAIASKNDENRIRALWPNVYGSRIELSDFASVKINWQSKADNVGAILAELNLLPGNVVFIDDNPVERENIAAAFPAMRTLGQNPYEVRRILLWSPETQAAYVTSESARRTEMVQAQIERENTRARLSRPEFLASLGVKLRLFAIHDVSDPRFARAFELINKSNQFNTTGRRWTNSECDAAFADGKVFWAFEVEDRFTQYGLVGVAITSPGSIEQFVMSCRVVGLDIENTVITVLAGQMAGPVAAHIVETEANFPCRDIFQRCGFFKVGKVWCKPQDFSIELPAHVEFSAPS